jgi:hypothetical protein
MALPKNSGLSLVFPSLPRLAQEICDWLSLIDPGALQGGSTTLYRGEMGLLKEFGL